MIRSVCRFVVAAVCAAALAPTASAQTINFESLLREIIDRDAITRFPVPAYTCKQSSSYDRKSTSASNPETWFANDDFNHFVRIDDNAKVAGGKEYVMLDVEGPGAVVRLWSANPPEGSNIRFYVDGEEKPVIEAPFAAFASGRWKIVEPLSSMKAKGYNSYVPIPYAKRMKVTCDKDGFYYQINYRTYEAGAKVESMTADAIEKAKAAIDDVQAALIDPRRPFLDPKDSMQEKFELAPGETKAIELPKGPNSVRYIAMAVRVPDDAPSSRALAWQNVVLEGEFDGEKTVWAPLSAFFGAGVGTNKFEDWYRNVLPAKYLHCRWIMPYKEKGFLKLTNTGKISYTCVMNIVTKAYEKWDDRTMYFHADWRYEYPIHASGGKGTKDWNYVELKGKGIFVADELAVMNPVAKWWGEGDEKIYVDGETFPSHFGTGTEDYYGFAWCSNEIFDHPFHGQPRCDGKDLANNYGHTTVTRSRSLDAIPFTKSFKFDMEIWHWEECDVAYGATVYYYAEKGATTNIKPMPEESGKEVLAAPAMAPEKPKDK